MIYLYNASDGILERCCFSGISSYRYVYGTSVASSWSIPKASINSTVTINCYGKDASHWSGYDKFTGFFNNNSYLTAKNAVSCYCHVRTLQNRDDVNCFFSGSSCIGTYPTEFCSDISDCIITKFNFVNNLDSNGYFRLVIANVKSTVKESVISFNSTPVKWIYKANSGSEAMIVDTFVIANEEPQSVQYVSTVNAKVVSKTSTYSQFKRHSERRECNSISKVFTQSLFFNLPFPFMSLTALAITTI